MKKNKILSIIISATCLISTAAPIAVSADEIGDAIDGFIYGDADLNGKIDIRDAAHIARFIAKRQQNELSQSADYNLDGKTDIRDAAAIARDIARKYVETRTHIHEWTDIYEEQPIYEEVPIYEEQTVKEYHDFINDEGSEYKGFDMTEAYREYKAQGGTLDITTWGRMYLEYELGIVWWTYIRKPVYVKTQVQVGTETVQTGTEQIYSHKECTCGAKSE